MSNSPLYNDLLTLGFNTATAPVGVDDVIYIKNQTDKVRKISISVTMGTPDILDNLTWQNPTLKRDPDIELGIRSCLAKGVIPITLQPVVLDNVAFESATSNITNLGSVLGYNDYTTTITTDNEINTVINHGIQGNRFTIHGLATDTFDLSTLGADAGDEVPVFEYNGLFWSARQIRNSLVYNAVGKPIIPVYVKWEISAEGVINQVAFIAPEINATFGITGGTSPAELQVNYAGFAAGTRYETQVLNLSYECTLKQLNTSVLIMTIPTESMLTTFASVLQANPLYNDTVIFDPVNGNIVNGLATRVPGKTQAFITARVPKAAYTHLELLQWTNPQLTVLRVGNVNYTVESMLDVILPHTSNDGTGTITEYYMPLWLDILEPNATNQTVMIDVGYGGLTLNNDWTVEHMELVNSVSYVEDVTPTCTPTTFAVPDPDLVCPPGIYVFNHSINDGPIQTMQMEMMSTSTAGIEFSGLMNELQTFYTDTFAIVNTEGGAATFQWSDHAVTGARNTLTSEPVKLTFHRSTADLTGKLDMFNYIALYEIPVDSVDVHSCGTEDFAVINLP